MAAGNISTYTTSGPAKLMQVIDADPDPSLHFAQCNELVRLSRSLSRCTCTCTAVYAYQSPSLVRGMFNNIFGMRNMYHGTNNYSCHSIHVNMNRRDAVANRESREGDGSDSNLLLDSFPKLFRQML